MKDVTFGICFIVWFVITIILGFLELDFAKYSFIGGLIGLIIYGICEPNKV